MLGASTLCFYNKNPQEAAYKLSKDFNLIEVVAEGRIPLSEKHEMPDVNLSVHASFSDLNIASANENILLGSLQEIKKSIELCAHFDARILTIHPGRLSPHTLQNPLLARKINVSSLEYLADLAEEKEIVLALENMPQNPALLGKTPGEMETIMKAVHSKSLKMTLDVGHANTTKNLFEFARLKKYLVNMHIHDNNGEDEHLPLGEGNIDFERFFKKMDYDGNVILELGKYEGLKKSKSIAEISLGL